MLSAVAVSPPWQSRSRPVNLEWNVPTEKSDNYTSFSCLSFIVQTTCSEMLEVLSLPFRKISTFVTAEVMPSNSLSLRN